MNQSLQHLRIELTRVSRMGAPIIFAGALYFAALFVLSFIIERSVLELIWVVGPGVVFPLGMAVARLMGADIFIKNNQLAVLAGVVGGIQALFIPVYIVVYKVMPEWLPFVIGTLTAAHFIPYIWLYQSKIYGVMIAAMALISIVFGSLHELSFTVVPLGIALIYAVSATVMALTTRQKV